MSGKSMVASGCLVLAACLFAGCEDDGDRDEDVSAVAERIALGLPEDVPDESAEDAAWSAKAGKKDRNFPDGLHPSSGASKKIARMFARNISPVSDAGGNDPNVVVCIGDSITKSYYARHLKGMVKMKVVNAGKGGEGSAGTAGRAGGVLSKHRPAYLCILTGINDISGGDASPEQVAANVESIVNAAKANNTIPIVGTLTPLSGSRSKWAADGRAASAAIRDVVNRTGARLADLDAAF